MSQRQRLLLLPYAAMLIAVSTIGLIGIVSGAPTRAATGVALVGLIITCAWRWNSGRLFGITLALAVVAGVVEGIVSQHAPVFGPESLRPAAAVITGPGAGLLVGTSLLIAAAAGWFLFIRRQPWGTAIIVASAFLVRADVDSRFASWLPLLVVSCLVLVLLANARSRPDLGRGMGMLIAAGAGIAICWHLPTPIPAWSRGFIDPLASAVGNRYGPSLSQALELTGEFQPSNRIVMSIRTGHPLARPYWRLAVFDQYHGQSWTPSSGTSLTVPAGASTMPSVNLGRSRVVNATITVDQSDSSLVSPGTPLGFSVASHASYAPGTAQPSSVTTTKPLIAGQSYRVSGVVSPIGLAPHGASASQSLVPYTEKPDEPQRVQALAHRIVHGAFGPVAQANALVHYLRGSSIFHYDTRAGSPPGQDAVDSFLFDTRRGYCNQFASALAILAREIGLPSRVVTGYVGGDYRDGSYLVRQRDAHSWVEIYIQGSGWLTFDPTPGFNAGRAETTAQARSAGLTGRRARLAPTATTSRASGTRAQPAGHAYRVPIVPPHVAAHPHRRGLFPPLLILVALVLLVLVIMAIVLQRRRPVNAYVALVRGQSRAGLRIRPEETPLEFVERFKGRAGYGDARLIVDLYIRERYAGVAPSPAERRAQREAWGRLRGRRLPTYSIVARR